MNTLIELFGILAAVLVFISLTQKDVKKLRIFNTIGSAMFVVYGLMIGSISVWLLNGAGVIMNLYRIWKSNN